MPLGLLLRRSLQGASGLSWRLSLDAVFQSAEGRGAPPSALAALARVKEATRRFSEAAAEKSRGGSSAEQGVDADPSSGEESLGASKAFPRDESLPEAFEAGAFSSDSRRCPSQPRRTFRKAKSSICSSAGRSGASSCLSGSAWELFVRGINPAYPPRQRAFEFLEANGVNAFAMELRELNKWEKWIEQRRVYGERFPVFPFDVTLEDKLRDARKRHPLRDASQPPFPQKAMQESTLNS